MQIRVYEDFSRLPLDRDQWNALVRRSGADTVFQTHEWATAWWKTFGSDRRLVCLVAEDDGVIRGLAPFMIAAGGTELRFVADANSDYCDVTIDGNRYAFVDAVLRFLAHDYPGWETLVLRNIPERSPTLAALLSCCRRYGLYPQIGQRIATPRIDFRSHESPFKLKYSVRRHSNRMERLGRLDYGVVQDRAELPAKLEVLYKQHVARYREKGERSLFEKNECRRFYATLAEELIDTGWLHFSELRLDDRPLATHFGFVYNDVLTWYKPAFDIDYGHYSPGIVLINRLIDEAMKRQLSCLDFTIGDEAFKARFSNTVAYNRNVVIYRSRRAALRTKIMGTSRAAARWLIKTFGDRHA